MLCVSYQSINDDETYTQLIQEQLQNIILDMERGILAVQPSVQDEMDFRSIEHQHQQK
jgi:hypothetical protein